MSAFGTTVAVDSIEAGRLVALACYRELAARILEAPVTLVSLIDTGRQWVKAWHELVMQETGLDMSVCARVLLQPGLTVVPDLSADSRFRGNLLVGDPQRPDRDDFRLYTGAPPITPEGVAVGMLCVLAERPRPDGIRARQRIARESLARQAERWHMKWYTVDRLLLLSSREFASLIGGTRNAS